MNIEIIRTWNTDKQITALEILMMHRISTELCLADILHKVRQDGTPISKEELLKDLDRIVDGERTMIVLLGRKTAAKVYGHHEGVTSAMATVDFVLQFDFQGHYSEIIERYG